MLELTAAGLVVLPDGTPLLAVVETRRVWRWFRRVETSSTETYVLKGGFWWGRHGERVEHRDARHAKLCELAMRERVRASIDAAVE
jgi:hypothetical protein